MKEAGKVGSQASGASETEDWECHRHRGLERQCQDEDEAEMLFSIQLRVIEDVRAGKCDHNHIEFLEMNLAKYVCVYICVSVCMSV